MKFDLIIKNGTIIDGSGKKSYSSDIGIYNELIVNIGNLKKYYNSSKTVIDANKLIITPGFIDVHSHSDATLIVNPFADSKIRQGVTTEIIGNCGNSLYPLTDKSKSFLSEAYKSNFGINLNWNNLLEYKKEIESKGISLNLVPLLGYRTVRISVMGYDNRKPNKNEFNEIISLVNQSMKQGCFGISTGLEYVPETFTKTEELISVVSEIAKYNGIYTSHIRGEGKNLIQSVREAIKIGTISKVPVHISHHKSLGYHNSYKINKTLKMIDDVNKKNIKTTFDAYPYVACSTNLLKKLPDWVLEGGKEKIILRLKDKNLKNKIIDEIKNPLQKEDSFLRCDWDKIFLVSLSSKKYNKFQGFTFDEISKKLKINHFDLLFDIIINEIDYGLSNDNAVYFLISDDVIEKVLSHDKMMVGSDGYSFSKFGFLSKKMCHPRSYGTFPRILSYYVKEKKLFSLEKAIYKMSYFSAKTFKIKKRGLIKEGYYADLVIFNNDEIKDLATFENPHQYPKGINFVIVNGTIVINKGKHTNELPGKFLLKKQ